MGRRNKKHRAATAARLTTERNYDALIRGSEEDGLGIAARVLREQRRNRINEARGLNAAPYDDEVAKFRARASR